jgi:predicted CXXCH cytochrome family protein
MKRHTPIALFLLSLLGPGGASGQPGRNPSGEHVSWTLESCMKCHKPAESAELEPRLSRPCTNLCATCHGFRDGHHPVGVTIEAPVPAPLQLTRNGTNACITCHDVTRPRFENSPWISMSLFERTLRRPKENRTYYLVMRNDRGQLCRNCH